MCISKELFDIYNPCNAGDVVITDNSRRKVIGMGTTKMKMFGKVIRTLGDMRHVHRLRMNLVSLSRFNILGYGFYGIKCFKKVDKDSLVNMKEKRKKMYKLIGDIVRG